MTKHIKSETHLTEHGDVMLVVHNGHRAGVAELRFDGGAPLGKRWKVVNCFLHRPMTRTERHHLSARPCVYTGHPHCYVAHWQALEESAQEAFGNSYEALVKYLYDVCEVA